MPWKDPAKRREAQAVYRAKNREKVRAAGKDYYQRNKNRVLAKQRSADSETKERRRAANLARYYRNKEVILAKRRAKSPEAKANEKEYRRKYREANREELRVKALGYYERKKTSIAAKERERRFGLAPGDFEAMVERQNGTCAICGCTLALLPARQTHIDHDHKTGRVRGILCHYCNTGLGHFRDDVEALRRAMTYLELHSKNSLV